MRFSVVLMRAAAGSCLPSCVVSFKSCLRHDFFNSFVNSVHFFVFRENAADGKNIYIRFAFLS